MLCDSAYIAVASKMLQELDLSQGPLGQDLLAEDIGNLLDCYSLACLVVRSRAITPGVSPRSPGNAPCIAPRRSPRSLVMNMVRLTRRYRMLPDLALW